MNDVSSQGVDERTINVHYYYYYIICLPICLRTFEHVYLCLWSAFRTSLFAGPCPAYRTFSVCLSVSGLSRMLLPASLQPFTRLSVCLFANQFLSAVSSFSKIGSVQRISEHRQVNIRAIKHGKILENV